MHRGNQYNNMPDNNPQQQMHRGNQYNNMPDNTPQQQMHRGNNRSNTMPNNTPQQQMHRETSRSNIISGNHTGFLDLLTEDHPSNREIIKRLDDLQDYLVNRDRHLLTGILEVKGLVNTLYNKQFRPVDGKEVPDFGKLKIPRSSQDTFNQLQNELEDKETCDLMVKYLTSVGGTNHKNIIERMLKAIVTDKAAMSYNMKGRGSKDPLSGSNVIKAIIVAGKSYSIKEAESEHIIGEWLRHAKGRHTAKSTAKTSTQHRPTAATITREVSASSSASTSTSITANRSVISDTDTDYSQSQ